MKVVFDTNVLLSAILTPHNPPARLLQLALEGKFQLLISPKIMEELVRVIRYPKLTKLLKKRRLTPKDLEDFLEKLGKIVIWTPGKLTIKAIPEDPADDPIIAGAVEGEADFLVSGDHHLLDLGAFQGIKILNPASFLEWFQKLEKE
ncbi:MAG: putative toxin-antitoxin system toxin component, PIN family [Thermodesulfobacteriota bacterium]